MRTFLRLAAMAAACGFIATAASAALPPQYQRLAELRAVLAHGEVARAFGSTPIDRVEYVRNDLYRVTAGRCHLDVAIIGLPMPRGVAGPRRFEARPGQKVCPR